MEIFVDGGVFEIIICLGIAYLFNFIFFRKYLLYLYCLLAPGITVVLLFVHGGPVYYLCVALTFTNVLLLVILLLQRRARTPNEELFNINAIKKKFPGRG